MLNRKPSILLCTYASSAFGASSSSSSSVGSTTSPLSRKSTRHRYRCWTSCRRYATVYGNDIGSNDGDRSHQGQQHVWPAPPKGQQHPTPYQIFAMTNTRATYSKSRFYELVKIYHPDKNNASLTPDAHAVKVERYRLIVAAHTILSDPSKRDAYDRFGAGWDGKANLGHRAPGYDRSGRPGPFTSSWDRPQDPIWRNATWEDWERFWAQRAREEGGPTAAQRNGHGPKYLQNSYFVILVAILSLVGSSLNYTRAKDAGTYYVAQRDLVHDQTAKDLRRVKQEASNGGRDQRIQWFLRNRDATFSSAGNDAEALREERADRLLPDREVCKSEAISEKDV